MTQARAPGDGFRVPAWAPAAVVLLVVAFTMAVRLRLAAVPLERDEGEYAYAGSLILRGIPPYKLAYNMKFPGTYYAYASILAVFGKSAWGVHAGLALVNAATTWLVFRLGRRLLGDFAGVVAAAGFALMSLDRGVLGVWAHATHFVVLAEVAGLLVLLRAEDSGRLRGYFAAGALLGAAVQMKQHAVFFVAFGVCIAFAHGLRRAPRDVRAAATRAAVVAAGAAVPFAAVVLLCAVEGVLGRFWFWTFTYAAQYVTQVSPSAAYGYLEDGVSCVLSFMLPFWIFAGAGLVALWARRSVPGLRAFVAGLAAASLLAVCPGLYFRNHYFVMVLPAAALLLGVATLSIDGLLARFLSPRAARVCAAGVFVALAARYVVLEREYLFAISPTALSRERYGANPFVEAPEIARYIRDRTGPDDRIAVLGSEPEICFYADRIAATGYLYAYAAMEVHPLASKMQDEMVREIEAARPEYVVMVLIDASWIPRSGSDRRILDWCERFLAERYDLVGVADIMPPSESRVLWDDAARAYQPVSGNVVTTYRRRSP